MGRKSISQQSKASATAVVSAKAPSMKFTEAAKLADKTSRTIAKLEQLVEVINSPAYTSGDPNRIVERYTETLKRRINKRLTKLARWSDSSIEERQAEFRRFYPSSSYNAYRPNTTSLVTPAPIQRNFQSLPSSTMIAVPTVTPTTVTVPQRSVVIAPETITPKNSTASIEAIEKVVVSMINTTTKPAVSQSEPEVESLAIPP